MAIYINNRLIVSIYHKNRAIKSVYKKGKLIWNKNTLILSCFSNGYWVDEYPWVDDSLWTD